MARETKDPERRCAVTGERGPVEAMLRFVIGPEDEVVPDLDQRLPGRGIWLCARRDVVKAASAKNAFARAARTRAVVPDDLTDRLEALLARKCIDGLALARRAGQAVAGFEKVKERIAAGNAALILAASDGAEDGRGKIAAQAGSLPIMAVLTGAELAQPFSRARTVHVAVSPGGLAERLKRDVTRLDGLRAGGMPTEADGVSERPERDSRS